MYFQLIFLSLSKLTLLVLSFTIIWLPMGLMKRPTVRTKNAIYYGKQTSVRVGKKTVLVDQFIGIRYGRAGRFQRSEPAWNLAEISSSFNVTKIDASRPANFCPQQSGFIDMFRAEFPEQSHASMDEDCLQLNIWMPNDSNQTTKPVLVWFHGGSFISDSSNRLLYQGTHLSARQNLIVVSVNYRLDAFGFLYSGLNDAFKTAQGNAALWDQLLALEWVQEHIEYFNGDPNRVTIGGFDSGATSVGLHILSAKSSRLFKQAIMISGSVFSQLVNIKASYSQQVSQMWASMASKISCGNGSKWTADTLQCLQQASVDQVLKLINPLGQISMGPEVIIGDELFPFDTLPEGLNRVRPKHNLTVLIGSTNDEGSQVLPIMNSELFSSSTPKPLDRNNAFNELKGLSSLLVTPRGCTRTKVDGNEVAQYYMPKSHTQKVNPVLIGQALGDFYVSCPMALLARQLVQRNVQVYQYVWSTKVTTNHLVPCFDWMGACHGTDVLMLFGIPFMSPESFSDHDRKASDHFMQTIGHFVHQGQPSKQNGLQWSAWSLSGVNGSLVAPYYQFIGLQTSTKRNSIFNKNWKLDLCYHLWSKYLMVD